MDAWSSSSTRSRLSVQGLSSFEETETTPRPRLPQSEILEQGPSSSEETEKLPTPRPRPSWTRKRLPPPKYGELITVLSIDGGGIRGLIPAVVLQKLEEMLRLVEKEDNPDVNTESIHIADYFDVIAGTSTGGLIAAMLTTPDDNNRPKFSAKEIERFYRENGPKIFPPKRWWWRGPIMGMVRAICVCGPKYDGTFLHDKIREVTGETKLDETLTTIVVPTFDVKRLEPIIFSSFRNPPEAKPKLSDVCIGTSAAPTYFPAHRVDRANGKKYHLIDGGVAANNPTMAAIARVIGEQLHRKEDLHALDYKKYLVISIGTGSAERAKGEYTAEGCAKWSDIKWVSNGGHSPIIDIFSQASDVLVDWQVRMLLHNNDKTDQEQNYLRIQAVAPLFEEHMLSMDTATRENMDKLVSIGKQLLNKKVARVDLTKGVYQSDDKDKDTLTNDVEIKRFARLLVNERNLRLQEEKKEKNNNDNNKKAMAQDGASTRESIEKPNQRAKKAMTQIIGQRCFPFLLRGSPKDSPQRCA